MAVETGSVVCVDKMRKISAMRLAYTCAPGFAPAGVRARKLWGLYEQTYPKERVIG